MIPTVAAVYDRRFFLASRYKSGGHRPPLQLIALALLGCVFVVQAQDSRGMVDVRNFGAKGDGKTVDTAAINKAIDAAAAAGGGTVRFPAGSYLTFSIQ